MIIRAATLADLRELDSLRRAEQEAVGFIPLSRWEEQVNRSARCLLGMWENGECTAYLYWTPGLPVAAIQQVVVRSDARRQERGEAIVRHALNLMGQDTRRYGATCRCRVDLEATAFWESLGFEACRLENTTSRRGPAIRYFYSIRPALLDLGTYLPKRTQTWGMRTGFRWAKRLNPKSGGRLLDGRTWDQFPEAPA